MGAGRQAATMSDLYLDLSPPLLSSLCSAISSSKFKKCEKRRFRKYLYFGLLLKKHDR